MPNGVGGLHSTTCVERWWHALLFMLQKCASMLSMFRSSSIKCQCLSRPMCRFSDDMTRFGATMHQLLCKILVIMQLACKWSHSTKACYECPISTTRQESNIITLFGVYHFCCCHLLQFKHSPCDNCCCLFLAPLYQCYHCSLNIENWFKYLVTCLEKVLKTNQLGINFTKNKL